MRKAAGQSVRSHCSRSGMVLIIVLVVVMMVAFAGFGFLGAMSTEYEATALNGAMLQAHATMASAEAQVLWLAQLPPLRREQLGGTDHNPGLFHGRIVSPADGVAGSPQAAAPGMPAVSAAGGPETLTSWRFSAVNSTMSADGSSVVRFGMRSESARLHPARILQWEQASPGAGREALMQLPGVSVALADCLLDWMDGDEQVREFGAESEYYMALPTPYRSANSVPVTLQELLFVRGMTAELLYGGSSGAGAGAAGNSVGELLPQQDDFDPAMLNAENNDPLAALGGDAGDVNSVSANGGADRRGLDEFLTLWSAERIQQNDGQARVRLNQLNPQQLRTQLSGRLPANLVEFIASARQFGLQPVEGTQAAGPDGLYVIPSLAHLVDLSVQRPAAAGGILEPVIRSEQPDASLLFDLLQNVITADTEQIVTGRIDPMVADLRVLSAIPGMGVENANELVSRRDSGNPMESRSLLWLVSGGIMTIEEFRKVFPELTDRSDVFQMELIVFRESGGPMLRRRLIVDGASRPARKVYWETTTDQPLPCPREQLLPAAF
jgi:hypothetical protein